MGIKFIEKKDRKKIDKHLKTVLNEIKKINKTDAEKLYKAHQIDNKQLYLSLKKHAEKISESNDYRKTLNELQEFNAKTYATLAEIKYLQELKKRF